MGKMISWPYTRSKGVTLVAPCLEMRWAHKALDNTSSHLLGLSSIFFLMSLTNGLLLDSAWPLAWA
jgi:hypothetical protein